MSSESNLANELTLFDLDCNAHTPFSPRVWAVRLLLNYKALPYRTTFVGFSSIARVLSNAGVPPSRKTEPLYTVPAIVDPSTPSPTKLDDCRTIAAYLEATYPNSGRGSVVLPVGDNSTLENLAIDGLVRAMTPLVVPGVVALLDETDTEYYVQSRRKMWGMELEEICPPGTARETAVQELLHAINRLSSQFPPSNSMNDKSTWTFGDHTPTFLDFELIGWLMWLKVAGLPGTWDAARGANGGRWQALLEKAEEEGLLRVV
ncbi:hypothetical protein C8F01DRAFT_1151754 [Mycena amicta]|nr:hypothetical protein C8F01DRAFT_1151754 [Mycena amicta]